MTSRALRTKSGLFLEASKARSAHPSLQSPWLLQLTILRLQRIPPIPLLQALLTSSLVPGKLSPTSSQPFGLKCPLRGGPLWPPEQDPCPTSSLNVPFISLMGLVTISSVVAFFLCFERLSPERVLTLTYSPKSSLKAITSETISSLPVLVFLLLTHIC